MTRGDQRDEQAGVPVVGVHDVRGPIHEVGGDRGAEERVAIGVVGGAIHDVTAEQRVVLDEHDPDPVAAGLPVPGAGLPTGKGHGAAARLSGRPSGGEVDRPMPRQVDGHLVAQGGEGLRERAGHVGEAAHLHVRGDLSGREDDAHPPIVRDC